MTSPSKIAVFCPNVLAGSQAWKLSAHGKKEQKPAEEGGKESEAAEGKRRTGRREGQRRWEGSGLQAAQLQCEVACQEANEPDLQVRSVHCSFVGWCELTAPLGGAGQGPWVLRR